MLKVLFIFDYDINRNKKLNFKGIIKSLLSSSLTVFNKRESDILCPHTILCYICTIREWALSLKIRLWELDPGDRFEVMSLPF